MTAAIRTGTVDVAGESWRPAELAAVLKAARVLCRKALPMKTSAGEEFAVPAKPTLWDLMEALDAPAERVEQAECDAAEAVA